MKWYLATNEIDVSLLYRLAPAFTNGVAVSDPILSKLVIVF